MKKTPNRLTPALCHPAKMTYSIGLCRTCHKNDWYARNPGAHERHRRATYLRRRANGKHSDYEYRTKYGIGLTTYEKMFAGQAGRCGICRDEPSPTKRLAVDHDHKTGVVRGLLCDACNLMLGHYERNSNAAKNLERYLAKTLVY